VGSVGAAVGSGSELRLGVVLGAGAAALSAGGEVLSAVAGCPVGGIGGGFGGGAWWGASVGGLVGGSLVGGIGGSTARWEHQ
jgi:hypothetical protein